MIFIFGERVEQNPQIIKIINPKIIKNHQAVFPEFERNVPRPKEIDDKLEMFVIFANRTGFRRILWHLSAQSLKARLHYVSPRSLDGDPRRVHGDDTFGLTRHLRNLAIRIHRELKAFLLQRRFVAAIFAANLLDVLHREVLAELAK